MLAWVVSAVIRYGTGPANFITNMTLEVSRVSQYRPHRRFQIG